MKTENAAKYFSIALAAVTLLTDQLIKLIAVKSGDYFVNSGMVFGLINNNFLSILISLVAVILVIYYLFVRRGPVIALSLLWTSLISNLIDRIVYGGVIDNYFLFANLWFNLADIAIVVSIIILTVIKLSPKVSSITN